MKTHFISSYFLLIPLPYYYIRISKNHCFSIFEKHFFSRAWCVECPDRELILANVQYDHVLEMLHCIHPTYKEVDDQSVHILLPLAFDYQANISPSEHKFVS